MTICQIGKLRKQLAQDLPKTKVNFFFIKFFFI